MERQKKLQPVALFGNPIVDELRPGSHKSDAGTPATIGRLDRPRRFPGIERHASIDQDDAYTVGLADEA